MLRISACLQSGLKTKVTSILVDGQWAAVEMKAFDVKAKAGWPYDQEYAWFVRFEQVSLLPLHVQVALVLLHLLETNSSTL